MSSRPRSRPVDRRLSPLWVAAHHPQRQRLALGHGRRGGADPAGGVVAAPGHRALAWPRLPSADPGQGRALPRHHRRRGLRPAPVPRSGHGPDAPSTASAPATTRSGRMKPWTMRCRPALPAQSPPLPRDVAGDRLRSGRCGAHRHRPWLHPVAAAPRLRQSRPGGPARRRPSHPGGWALGGLFLSSSGRHHRPARARRRCNLCLRTPVTSLSGLHRCNC